MTTVRIVVGGLMFVAAVLWLAAVALVNLDMTGRRLLVAHPVQYLTAFAVAALGLYMMRRAGVRSATR